MILWTFDPQNFLEYKISKVKKFLHELKFASTVIENT